MKKVLSIVLAIAMIATMSAVAFAGEDVVEAQVTFAGEDVTIPVTGDFSEDGEVDNWKVNISWTEDFDFTFTSGKVWDVENHEWDLATGEDKGTWNNGSKNITVVNHSSEAISVTPSYAATLAGTNVTFDKAEYPVASAVDTEVAEAPEATIVATFNGGDAVLEIGATDVTLGTITLAIA
ncbi:MAG: hypothetical protein IJ294_05460 [Clostridia bacterium]|nr:hypothetical protein [Clostridia bacterium]